MVIKKITEFEPQIQIYSSIKKRNHKPLYLNKKKCSLNFNFKKIIQAKTVNDFI